MAILNFQPWLNKQKLHMIREQIYPRKGYNGPDMRANACEEVASWMKRVSVPCDIESTHLLTEAVLNDTSGNATIAGATMMYSTAFSRFVSLLVDNQQKRKHKSTMFDIGLNIGLPVRFVALRHHINHGELPTLATLREYANEALDWLYKDYWTMLGETYREAASDDVETFRASFKITLRQHRNSCRDAFASRKPSIAMNCNSTWSQSISKNITRFCRNDAMKLQIVVDILLGFDMLVLCARPLGGSMKATFQVWETLLVAITNHQNKFLQSLNASMISRLVCATTPDCAVDSFREGLSEWLSYIWSSERWKKGRERSNLAFNTLMESCLSSPGYWTLHVAHCVVTSATWTSRRESWEGKILEAMKADKEASVAAGQNTVENAADETSAYKLGNMGAALLEVLSDDKSNENVSMAPPAPFFTTLAFRNSRNPWCATPVGTSNM